MEHSYKHSIKTTLKRVKQKLIDLVFHAEQLSSKPTCSGRTEDSKATDKKCHKMSKSPILESDLCVPSWFNQGLSADGILAWVDNSLLLLLPIFNDNSHHVILSTGSLSLRMSNVQHTEQTRRGLTLGTLWPEMDSY